MFGSSHYRSLPVRGIIGRDPDGEDAMWRLWGSRRLLGAVCALVMGIATLAIAAPASAQGTVGLSKSTMAFGQQRVGTFGDSQVVTITNTSAVDVTFSDIA